MAKRLISLRDLDTLEGLVTQHYKLQQRLEDAEAAQAQYDTPDTDFAEGVKELVRLRVEVTQLLNALIEPLDTR